ncbi:cryptochrome/photolyase family protein [Paracoccus contaminans]|uniref:Cryptochrome/photolyase family protein n=1 Tax=Paracoccus contaminans TaxID=1945662 RepID=A0A1W6CW42_9RHOB|nr:cryptochrome/photolyase family protein [Paracoccus contaminans]ARJ69098.1 cryptochrome/photolyase family protein [Paracoccus contaminans]
MVNAQRRLILILGDQLTPDLSAFDGADPARDVVLMAEVAAEAGYVDHHRQKLALVFAAMRHFAAELRAAGWTVDYRALPEGLADLATAAAEAIARHRPALLIATEPGEYRLQAEMEGWEDRLGLPVLIRQDRRFLCTREDFAAWAEGRRTLVMEHFYRVMRRRTGLLMEGEAPVGGRWNFDAENRKPARPSLFLPAPLPGADDPVTREVLALVADRFPASFGALTPFRWQVTRAGAEAARDRFLTEALPHFGETQDAMLAGQPWMHHALLSPYLNLGLLDPLDLCSRAEAEWRAGRAPLAAVEGFIRQIIGWREYVRGVYWLKMPGYAATNALDARQPLPDFYWTGRTDMACLSEVIGQTIATGYANHIQRLMIAGTYALLIGADPVQVHRWYLGVYVDAYEWVELPNTLGMSQFADGGLLATKPYAASAAYVNRMSDYCRGCRFDPKMRLGPRACPWNALYWDFIARHADRWARNPRMAVIVKAWAAKPAEEQAALRAAAAAHLGALRGYDAAAEGAPPVP